MLAQANLAKQIVETNCRKDSTMKNANEPKPIIQLNGIAKSYPHPDPRARKDKAIAALRNITLSIHKGEFVVIKGESGSGKTTLLKIIGLLDNDYQGSYKLNNIAIEDLKNWEYDELRAANVGFVFQDGKFFSHLNMHKNINVPLHFSRRVQDNQQNKQPLPQGSEQQFFKPYEIKQNLPNKSPSQLSGGQQQRFAIWRSIIDGRPIILADEPTASLDNNRKAEIVERFKELSQQGYTVVIVSHDSIFHDYGRQITIENGTIINDDNSKALSTQNSKPQHTKAAAKSLLLNIPQNTYQGWKPRASFLMLAQNIGQELKRWTFSIILLSIMVIGIVQIGIFLSLRAGAVDIIEEITKQGSRLNRITIQKLVLDSPENTPENNPEQFSIQEELHKWHEVDDVVIRLEDVISIKNTTVEDSRYYRSSTIGLHNNDPEYQLFDFMAGGEFSQDDAFEIIISNSLANILFHNDFDNDENTNIKNLIGRNIQAKISTRQDTVTELRSIYPQLKVVGIISKGEGSIKAYLPHRTVDLFRQYKQDKALDLAMELNAEKTYWQNPMLDLSPNLQGSFLHVYIDNLQQVIPTYKRIAQAGEMAEAEVFNHQYVVNIRKYTNILLKNIAFINIFLVILIIWSNLHIISQLKEKEFALWRILGMRKGSLFITQISYILFVSLLGCAIGSIITGSCLNWGRNMLKKDFPDLEIHGIIAPLASNWLYWLTLIIILVLVMVIAAFPAHRIANTSPAKILD